MKIAVQRQGFELYTESFAEYLFYLTHNTSTTCFQNVFALL